MVIYTTKIIDCKKLGSGLEGRKMLMVVVVLLVVMLVVVMMRSHRQGMKMI